MNIGSTFTTTLYLPHTELPFAVWDAPLLISSAIFVDNCVVADTYPYYNTEWAQSFPERALAAASAERLPPADWLQALTTRYPWLTSCLNSRRSSRDIVARDDQVDFQEEFSDSAVDEALEHVTIAVPTDPASEASRRLVMRFRSSGFGVSDKSPFVVATEAAKGMPRTFVTTYGFLMSVVFSAAQLGETQATRLAGEWCDHIQFLFDIGVCNQIRVMSFPRMKMQCTLTASLFVHFATRLP